MKTLPEMICEPCPDRGPVRGDRGFLDEDGKLPSDICCDPGRDLPPEPEPPVVRVVTSDCYLQMLKNMTSSKFCDLGPAAC